MASLAACEYRALYNPDPDEYPELDWQQMAASVREFFSLNRWSPTGVYGVKPPARWKEHWSDWEARRHDARMEEGRFSDY